MGGSLRLNGSARFNRSWVNTKRQPGKNNLCVRPRKLKRERRTRSAGTGRKMNSETVISFLSDSDWGFLVLLLLLLGVALQLSFPESSLLRVRVLEDRRPGV